MSKRRLVLGDLGHAKSINAQGSSKKSKSRLDSFGTDGYIAPEIITEDYEYSEKIDIWLAFYTTHTQIFKFSKIFKLRVFIFIKRSFGCVLFEMIMLKKLFEGKTSRDLERKLEDFSDDNFRSAISLSLTSNLIFSLVLEK